MSRSSRQSPRVPWEDRPPRTSPVPRVSPTNPMGPSMPMASTPRHAAISRITSRHHSPINSPLPTSPRRFQALPERLQSPLIQDPVTAEEVHVPSTSSASRLPTSQEQQAILANNEDRSYFEDPLVQRFIPYSLETTQYPITPEQIQEFSYEPECARSTSWCRAHPQVNEFRRVYRRMSRTLYHIRIPKQEENIYPSPDCISWAQGLFDSLDQLTIFRPTCLATRKRVPMVDMTEVPAYGAFYLALMQSRNQAAYSEEDLIHLPEIPKWPSADNCLFTSLAFEVAAVAFRDEVERFITALYIVHIRHNESRESTPVSSQGTIHPEETTVLRHTLEVAQNLGQGYSLVNLTQPKLPPFNYTPSGSPPKQPPATPSLQKVLPSKLPSPPKPEQTLGWLQQVVTNSPKGSSKRSSPIWVRVLSRNSLQEEPSKPEKVSLQMEEMRGDQISSASSSTSFRDSYQEDLNEGIADQEPTQPQIVVTSISPSQLSTSSISSIPLGEPVQSSVPAHYTSQYGILSEENISLRNRPPTPRPPMSSDLKEPSDRTGTPNSLLLDQTSAAHISSPPSPAESELSITSSAASRVIHAPIAQSTPGRSQILLEEEPELMPSRRVSFPGEGQPIRDPPPHAAFVTRRTSIGTRRASGRPMVQPESFTRVSVIPEEEEVIVPAVPPRSRTSTKASQRTPEETPECLYIKEPLPPQQASDINLSRREQDLDIQTS
ncbi:Retrovirus-related Pol polyprotein [Ceratobasidium theobromae]|uniref:Retrovirus-related Pol polyprotein n=1 Tax=Ceratobasidium theobromae TaxID=1582974 RepID=A0A5N5Q7E9_9AGAM|nr:Retrovirus-related Pol polyprotein [Ceratobasidium theobromae]